MEYLFSTETFGFHYFSVNLLWSVQTTSTSYTPMASGHTIHVFNKSFIEIRAGKPRFVETLHNK